jgi:hypothetical protein
MVGYHHFKKLPIKMFLFKEFYSPMFYKFDFGVLKFKNLLLKPKLNLLNLKKLFLILQHSNKSFNTNFFNQHDIEVALHKYVSKF